VRVELEAGKADSVPAQPSQDLLLRGQERYDIYCLPCHSAVGDGDGPVVRRGFPAPPSYHQPRLIAAPDRHFYDVISHGYGVMFSYADRVAPADRWAIVAYIRALQLSQHAPVASLPAALRESLIAAKSEGVKAPPAESASAPAKAPR
jgi:mono/diheme cytochrome c family protein